jgi:hypothetical protein
MSAQHGGVTYGHDTIIWPDGMLALLVIRYATFDEGRRDMLYVESLTNATLADCLVWAEAVLSRLLNSAGATSLRSASVFPVALVMDVYRWDHAHRAWHTSASL